MTTGSGTRRFEGLAPDVGAFLIRLMLSVVFVYHGSQKLFGAFGGPGLKGFSGFLASLGVPAPEVGAVLAGAAEFLGGLALLTGIGLRLLSLPLVITMLVGCFTAHAGKFSVQNGGMEYALTLAVVVAGMALIGPGSWTLPRIVRAKT